MARVKRLQLELHQSQTYNAHRSSRKSRNLCVRVKIKWRISVRYSGETRPNVRSKVKDIDHLLDEEYITVRIKMKKTITLEVDKSTGWQKTGRHQKKQRES